MEEKSFLANFVKSLSSLYRRTGAMGAGRESMGFGARKLSSLWRRQENPLEIRLIQLLAAGVEDFGRSLQEKSKGPSPLFHRVAHEAKSLYVFPKPLSRPRLVFRVAQTTRDVFGIMETAWQEMALYELSPDAFCEEMAGRTKTVAKCLRVAIEEGKGGTAREALEKARGEVRGIRPIYEKALEELLKGRNAVEILKRRELYRHLWRLSESLTRCFRPLEESWSAPDPSPQR